MLATYPAVDNVRTRLPSTTSKNYVPKGFSVRVFKGPTAGQPSASATFNVGYRGVQGEQAPAQNWYQPRTTNDSRNLAQPSQNSTIPPPPTHDLNAQLLQPRSRFSIYQNGDNYVYEPSLSTNNDIYSNSDFDSSATSLTSSATGSTDSLVAIKSPPTSHASLPHDQLRSQGGFDATGRSSSDRSLQSYPTTSGSTNNNHHLYIRTDQNTLSTPSHLLPSPARDDLDSPLYPPSTVSEFERREREILAKANAEYNASSSSSGSSTSSYQAAPMLAIPVPPSQRSASTAPSATHQYFPTNPLRGSPEQEPPVIPRLLNGDVRPVGGQPTPSSYRPASDTMRRNSVEHTPGSFKAHRSSVAFPPSGSNEGPATAGRYVPLSQTMVSNQPNPIYAHGGPGPAPNGAVYDPSIPGAPAYPPPRNIYSDPHSQPTPVYGLNRTPSRSSPRQEIVAPVPSSHRPPTTHVSAGTPPRTSPQGSPHSLNRVPSQRGSPPAGSTRDRLSPNHAPAPRTTPPQIYRPADPPVSIPGAAPVPQSSFAGPSASRGSNGSNVIMSANPTPLSHVATDLRHPAPPTGRSVPQRRHSDGETYVPHPSTITGPQPVVSVEAQNSTRPESQHRRYSDGDQTMVSSATHHRHAAAMQMSRSVRWNENLICPSPLLSSQRRKGWFNRRGDQLWTNNGAYKAAPDGQEYPPDLNEYPEHGEGWMNEEGVRIDMQHRLIPKMPKKSALKIRD